jgi:hypothetical protein
MQLQAAASAVDIPTDPTTELVSKGVCKCVEIGLVHGEVPERQAPFD